MGGFIEEMAASSPKESGIHDHKKLLTVGSCSTRPLRFSGSVASSPSAVYKSRDVA